MKAKDLIKILKQYPDYHVGFEVYNGGLTPFRIVKSIKVLNKNNQGIEDGGDFIDYKTKRVQQDLIVLLTYKEEE